MADVVWVLVPLSAIMLGPIMYWLHIKAKQVDKTSELAAEKAAQYANQVATLEQRVRTLEQIVTDGGYQTAAQIEALREVPAQEQSTVRVAN